MEASWKEAGMIWKLCQYCQKLCQTHHNYAKLISNRDWMLAKEVGMRRIVDLNPKHDSNRRLSHFENNSWSLWWLYNPCMLSVCVLHRTQPKTAGFLRDTHLCKLAQYFLTETIPWWHDNGIMLELCQISNYAKFYAKWWFSPKIVLQA